MTKEMLVIGAGGHCRVVVETAQLLGHEIKGIIDLDFSGQNEEILGVSVIGGWDQLEKEDSHDIVCALAIGDGETRKRTYEKLESLGIECRTLVHPEAWVSPSASLGNGTWVGPKALIHSEAVLGHGAIINSVAIIEHECQVGAFSHIAPGAKLGGRVRIGELTLVGTGAILLPKIVVGDSVSIGAGSIVTREVESGQRVVNLDERL